MKIHVHAVGRMKAGPERELAQRYFDRFAKVGPAVGLEFGGVGEIVESRAGTAAARQQEEAERLLAAASTGVLVLLDENGTNPTSPQLAARLADFRDQGTKSLTLAIGGPDGHPASLRRNAAWLVSFGALTWPHQMVRIMLAEQLYRAATILSGHPYHRV